MAVRQYTGARYVPKFADPVRWDNERDYEALTIVTYFNNSYTSKKPVPAGVDITDTEYWVVTGNYNAQVEEYRQLVEAYKDDVEKALGMTTTIIDLGSFKPFDDLGRLVNNLIEEGYYSFVLPRGEYNLKTTIDSNGNSFSLRGEGYVRILADQGKQIFIHDNQNIRLDNLVIVPSGDIDKDNAQGIIDIRRCSHVDINNCVMNALSGSYIALRECKYTVIKNCSLTNNASKRSPAIWVYNCSGLTIDSCYISNNFLDGMILAGDNSDRVSVVNTEISRNGIGEEEYYQGALGASGIYSSGGLTNFTVNNCVIAYNGENGIDLLCPVSACSITDNNISHNELSGVVFGTSATPYYIQDVIVSGNKFINNGKSKTEYAPTAWGHSAINARNNVGLMNICNNDCRDLTDNKTQRYLFETLGSAVATRVFITGNSFYGNLNGLTNITTDGGNMISNNNVVV